MFKPLVFGEALYDCFDETCQVGGAPFNVAWHLQGFGDEPLLVSAVSDDELGDRFKSTMVAWGLSTKAMTTSVQWPTGRVQVSLQKGQPHYDILDQQAYDKIEFPERLVTQTRNPLIYHGTLALRHSHNRDLIASWRHRYPVFLDVNLRDPWWHRDDVMKWIRTAQWLKLNQDEHALLLGRDELPQKWFDWASNLRAVILTDGDKGAAIVTRQQIWRQDSPRIGDKFVDAVGAGDAFSSVVIHGLMQDWEWERILYEAIHFAALVCQWRGAVKSDLKMYREVIHGWQ